MYYLSQVLAIIIPCIILFTCYPTLGDAQPQRTSSDDSGSGRFSVSVVRSSVKEFLTRNADPEKEIEQVESRTALTVTTHSQTEQSREPTWFSKQGKNIKKIKRRNRRKRQKSGAKINTDHAYITDHPTNSRVYKYCNKLGYFLRLNPDGTVDGTNDRNDIYTILVFESRGTSILRIKGYYSNKYLTMDSYGVPSVKYKPKLWESLFRLTVEENTWETIASYGYYFEEKFDMLVGITKDARLKQPWKSSPGQYATQFLPIAYPPNLLDPTKVITPKEADNVLKK